jgi:DNA polymerase III alpha subunit (gram-positive type)
MSPFQRKPVSEANLLFVDLETSGLSATNDEIIELAAILTDPSGRITLKEYCTKIFPEKPVHPKAAAVNGYTIEKWAGEAINLNTALKEFVMMAKDTVMVAHNINFDWQFIEENIKRNQMRWPGYYNRGCTMSLSFPLLKKGLIENCKLATVCAFFSIEQKEAHTAMSDVNSCREVYLRLMDRLAE